MKGCMSGLLMVWLVLGLADRSAAQLGIPIALELRADAAFPAGGDFAEHAETGVGFGVNAAGLRLTPGVGYRRFTAPFLHDESDVPIAYFSAGVGLNLAF